jgi:glucokinase
VQEAWAVGVDLGGTKLEVARVDVGGTIRDSLRMPTKVEGGPPLIEADIAQAVDILRERAGSRPVGVGVGTAGQIDRRSGAVHFSPNLGWHDVPLCADLEGLTRLPVIVTNDVRAITWGEWLHGAGRGFEDLICLYVGTGIGGGVVSGGRMLSGCTNTAGELGHITIDINGPSCTCGNRGCLEALAGGWAIARDARRKIRQEPVAGRIMLDLAGGILEDVTAETVARSALSGDTFAQRILADVGNALIAGCVSLVNAFNPCRLILGGGVIDGVPDLIETIRLGVQRFALEAAGASLEVLPGALGSAAGMVGAAGLAMCTFGEGADVGR